MKKLFFLLIIVIFSFSCELQAQIYQRTIVSPDGKTYHYKSSVSEEKPEGVYVYDHQTRSLLNFYSTLKDDKRVVDSLFLSPNGGKVAYISYYDLSGLSDGDGYYILTILNSKSMKEIISFDHAGLCSFSPDGEAIVCAEKNPGGKDMPPPPGFKGEIWIYNFNIKSKRTIETKQVGAKDLNWSKHDGNIYIYNGSQFCRYDVKKEKGEIVDIKSIYFSSDGKYYCRGDYGGTRSYIYRASDNTPVVELNDKLSKLSSGRLSFESWALDGNAILYRTDGRKYFIFDINNGEVLQEFEGKVIGGNHSGTRFIFYPVTLDAKERNILDRTTIEFIDIKIK